MDAQGVKYSIYRKFLCFYESEMNKMSKSYLTKQCQFLVLPIQFQYCRVLEFSIPTTAIQLLLCLIALFAGLNRRNNLFVCVSSEQFSTLY